MTRKPLNKPLRRAVQCRDQFVVNRLVDRGHPNKVSMKKKKKEEEGRARQPVFMAPGTALVLSEILDLANQNSGSWPWP